MLLYVLVSCPYIVYSSIMAIYVNLPVEMSFFNAAPIVWSLINDSDSVGIIVNINPIKNTYKLKDYLRCCPTCSNIFRALF